MSWYKNINLKAKFLFTFGVVIILVAILGFVGLNSNSYSTKSYNKAMDNNKEVVMESLDIISSVIEIRINAFQNLNKINLETVQSVKDEMKIVYDAARKNMQEFLEILNRVDENGSRKANIDLANSILSDLEQYYNLYLKFVDAIAQDNLEEANRIDAELLAIGERFFSNIYLTPANAFNTLSSDMDKVDKQVTTKGIILFIVFIIILAFVVIFGNILSASIRKPVDNLKNIALKVAKGNLDVKARTNNRDEIGELSNAVADMAETLQYILDDIIELSSNLEDGNISYRINSNNYEGAFKNTTESINMTVNQLIEDSLYVIDTVKEFGDGKFDATVKDFPGDKIIIKEGLTSVQTALKNVSKDIVSLIEAANEGDLEFRLDTNKYVGEWKETTDGLNSFVENVVVPIKETQNALNQFSKGNFAHRITNEYKGEFNNIKQTVNFTAETIGSYINEISETLTEMANKNFDISIDREYLGDFESIKQSVNLIVDNLNVLTKDIISSAEQVSSGARQIAESSTSLAQGATEQAGAVEELTSTVSIISEQSKANAVNSDKANALALDAKDSAANGSQQMDKMLLAMEEINTASNSISNIIKVIDDIAFQTNILALNAAVEAARAGEHGKGFAVVAEEVRSLAARSQQAAKETTELIESSVSKVEEGSKIANDTAESLVNIVKQIEEISSLINSCAVSSKEQEKSIEQITIGIDQISVVTQSNTATSEESAAASEELSSQADIFYASVSDFKLRD